MTTRVPIGQLQVRQIQVSPQQQGRLVLRAQQQIVDGVQQQSVGATRHLRPSTDLSGISVQQRSPQRASAIASSQVVPSHSLTLAPVERLKPSLHQQERQQEEQNRLNVQFSSRAGNENKLIMPIRCVRFGTFKMNSQRSLEFTAEHINLVVIQDQANSRRKDEAGRPLPPRPSSISFVIAFKHIRRIEFSFTNTNSVMFLTVNEYCGRKIRESLGIDADLEAACADERLSYFNPDSPLVYHQMITIMTDVETCASRAANELSLFFKQVVEVRRRELKLAEFRKQNVDQTVIPTHAPYIEPLLRKLNVGDARKRFTDVFPPHLTQQMSGPRRNSNAGYSNSRAAAGGAYNSDNLSRPPISARYAPENQGGPSTSYRTRLVPQQHPPTQVIANGQVIVHAAKGSHVIVCQSPQAVATNGQQILGQILPAGISVKGVARRCGTAYGYAMPQGVVTTKVITIKKPPVKRPLPPTVSQTIMLEDEVDGDEPSTSKCGRVDTLFAYPEGERGAVTVHVSDMECLNDEQFLNDTIIDFHLKYTLRQSPPDLQARVHIFNTFFWRRLTLRPRAGAFTPDVSTLTGPVTKQQSNMIARYNSVKSWTKDVDIFEKDFVIVPINEDAHWYLAIICYPMSAVRREMKTAVKSEPVTEEDPAPTDASTKTTCPPISAVKMEPMEEQTVPTNSSTNTSSPSRPPSTIVLLDSLRDAANRYKTVSILKEYLLCEWEDKGKEKATGGVFDRQLIKGCNPKNVPQQDNYWDCGVYVLEYIERFLKQPPEDILQGNKNDYSMWFPDFSVANKRADVRSLIKSMCTEEKWALVPPPVEAKIDEKEGTKGRKRFKVVNTPKEVLERSGRQSAPPSPHPSKLSRRSQSTPPSINH
uniref:Ubiquitin-like protease family profile domain-containing protein n=1 Tax=Plectus sambesii TaxID=2011161 RepID=A0A914W2A2_9BILA